MKSIKYKMESNWFEVENIQLEKKRSVSLPIVLFKR